MKIINILKLFGAILICVGMGFLGSLATTPSINTWYVTLNKPVFNPPNWLFAPVWTILFICMGISLYLVWQSKIKNKSLSLTYFYIQLILNLLWSFIFFTLHNPLFAFIEIIILWIFILLTIIGFYRISKPASLLLWPYLLWVTFASILNFSIYILN